MKKNQSAGEMEAEPHPFEPFTPENASVLFLGSFPPQQKRWSMDFYYPNWINDFWRICGLLFFGDKDYFCLVREKRFDKEKVIGFCREKGLAFYDTASEVRRLKDNASDKFLEVVTPTDVPALLAVMPLCGTVVATGEKAAQTLVDTYGGEAPAVGECSVVPGLRRGSGVDIKLWRMPSSSRAYPLPLERKAEVYRRLFAALGLLQ